MSDELYKNNLGLMESGGNYRAAHPATGALGKYQFLPSTLTSLQNKYNLTPWIDKDHFLINNFLQEVYIDALIRDTRGFILRNNLSRYIGNSVTGSKRFYGQTARLNESGLLAESADSGLLRHGTGHLFSRSVQ